MYILKMFVGFLGFFGFFFYWDMFYELNIQVSHNEGEG